MNKKEVDYLHELKMQELAFERETELLKVEHKFNLEQQAEQRKMMQQYNPTLYVQQPQTFQPQQFQQQSEQESNEEKSRKKYGGGK